MLNKSVILIIVIKRPLVCTALDQLPQLNNLPSRGEPPTMNGQASHNNGGPAQGSQHNGSGNVFHVGHESPHEAARTENSVSVASRSLPMPTERGKKAPDESALSKSRDLFIHLDLDDEKLYRYVIHVNTGALDLIFSQGSVAEWLARRTRDLEVAGSIPNQAML